MSDVRGIDSTLVDEAARTLAGAFADDPVFRWMARDRSEFDAHLRSGFAAMLRGALRREASFSDDSALFITACGGCAAIWHRPDAWKASAIDSMRVLPAFVRSFGLRLDRLLRVQSALDAAHPTDPHYHLAFIGTRPTQQGTGLGGSVLTPMIERCDTEGMPAYLESSNPRNEALYVRHGFEATGEIPLPSGAPPMTAMWRRPR